MGVSVKNICVYDDKVYEIPLTKIKNGKMEAPKLSGQNVLKMEIIYEIKNRKPEKILRIIFNKITFDHNGIYKYGDLSDESRIQLEYTFSDLLTSLPSASPLPIPIAPVIPSEEEILVLKNHLNRKYPLLLMNSPYAIEDAIAKSEEMHKENIQKMKLSHRTPNMSE